MENRPLALLEGSEPIAQSPYSPLYPAQLFLCAAVEIFPCRQMFLLSAGSPESPTAPR